MFLFCLSLLAQQNPIDDLDALKLADNAPKTVQIARDWHSSFELGLGQSRSSNQYHTAEQRFALELGLDTRLSSELRAVFDYRLDQNWQQNRSASNASNGQDRASKQTRINTIKAAYLSWQIHEQSNLDLGRINAYQGVALGYNPTDFF
ncbi:MAG: hypothetical protein K2P84_02185, partial [Undibacterium sp.]|nr:hypothetical protein [Undibacterium sp.]